MKFILIMLIVFMLIGCAVHTPIQKQKWYPQYVQDEIDNLEEELLDLIDFVEDGNLTFKEYEWVCHQRFNYFRIRLSGTWIQKKKDRNWDWIRTEGEKD